jgi:hypothetical protein
MPAEHHASDSTGFAKANVGGTLKSTRETLRDFSPFIAPRFDGASW